MLLTKSQKNFIKLVMITVMLFTCAAAADASLTPGSSVIISPNLPLTGTLEIAEGFTLSAINEACVFKTLSAPSLLAVGNFEVIELQEGTLTIAEPVYPWIVGLQTPYTAPGK